MPIGPTLLPVAGKRKRDDATSDEGSDSSDDTGPQPPNPKPQDATEVKKARVMGPSLPPSAQEVAPKSQAADKTDDAESSDDDDYGPSLPSATDKEAVKSSTAVRSSLLQSGPAAPSKSTRDEWMTLAPSSGDWSQRVDPTKLKNRKFNTGVSATASRSGGDSWHETPEQKQARLQREVLGMKDDKGPKTAKTAPTATGLDEETARRMEKFHAQRGPSLYEAHQKGEKAEAEDDPSARAFDREKDIGGGLQINATKRKDMLKKSADFDSRFSRAKYL